MEKIETILASGRTHATVNRESHVRRGKFGAYNLTLSAAGLETIEYIGIDPHPKAERLFAGAWSACYTTVFGMAAQLKKVTLPPDYSVDIKVNIGQTDAAWLLGAEFTVRVPGLSKDVVESIAHLAHQICPYSKSVHGNIDVVTNVVTV